MNTAKLAEMPVTRQDRVGWLDKTATARNITQMGQRKRDRRKLKTLARRYLWWESPTGWEDNPDRLIRQVLSLGTVEDYLLIRAQFGRRRIVESLRSSPAGAIDARSWNYWHRHFNLPVPPQPRRCRPRAEA